MHVLQLGSDEFVLLQCYCYLLLFVCVCELFCCLYCYGFTGVMIGMSGESWHHKSTLRPVPSSLDWACRSSSLLLSFRLRHFIILVFSIYIYYFNFIYLFIFKFIHFIFYIYFYLYIYIFNVVIY